MSYLRGLVLVSLTFAAVLMAGCNSTSSSTPVANLPPASPDFNMGDSTPGPPAGGLLNTPADPGDRRENSEDTSPSTPPLEAPPAEMPGTPSAPPLYVPGAPASPEPPRVEAPSAPPLYVPDDDEDIIAGNPDGGDEGNLSDQGNTPELGTCALLLLSGITAGVARLRRRKKS